MPSFTRSILLFLWIAISTCPLGAQRDDSLRYSGALRVGERYGYANYEYFFKRRDTVRQGGFAFERINPGGLVSGTDDYVSFTGRYEANQPVGPWQLRFGEYQPGDRPAEIEELRYVVPVSGLLHEASGPLLAGEPDSLWVQEIQRVVNSEPAGTEFRSEITFQEGVARQSFRLESGPHVLLGRVLRNGVAEDEWILYDDLETAERWRFAEGQLKYIVRGGDTLATFADLSGRTEEVDLDARYLDWLRLQLRMQGNPTDLAGNPVVDLLTRNAEVYARTFAAIRDLGGDAGRPLFRVSLPVNPLTRRELANLEMIDEQLRAIDTLSRSILSNTALSVVENKDPEVASLRSNIVSLRDTFLAPVRQLRDRYRGQLLPYVDRDDYLAVLFRGRDLPAGLPEVATLVTDARRRIDSTRNVLGEKNNTRERKQAITALDEQLAREYYLLDSLLAGRTGTVPERYGLASVQSLAATEMRRYADTDDQLDRERRAQDLIRCVENLDALALTLIRSPEREDAVRAAYTDEVWNNFTATVMEERIKKRLYRAYEETLIPYYLERVRTELSCGNAVSVAEDLTGLHQRMLELRDADTDDLESSLRRLEDPVRILRLINNSEPQ